MQTRHPHPRPHHLGSNRPPGSLRRLGLAGCQLAALGTVHLVLLLVPLASLIAILSAAIWLVPSLSDSIAVRLLLWLLLLPLTWIAAAPLELYWSIPKPVSAPIERWIERSDAPELYRLMDEVASLLGAPTPDAVVLDLQVNASAQSRTATKRIPSNSTIPKSDSEPLRVVQLGLPLLMSLSERQLAGVVAHELRHFQQGLAARMAAAVGQTIQRTSQWSTRVSPMDRWLDEATVDRDLRLAWPARIAKLFRHLPRALWRQILPSFERSLGWLTHPLEYEADEAEAEVAGSDCFAETLLELMHLSAASAQAIPSAQLAAMELLRIERLAELVIHLRTLQETQPQHAWTRSLTQRELDQSHGTHPPLSSRIARVERMAAPGRIVSNAPAWKLLGSVDASKAIDLQLTSTMLGRLTDAASFPVESLIPCDPTLWIARHTAQRHALQSLLVIFGPIEPIPVDFAWEIPSYLGNQSPSEVRQELFSCAREMAVTRESMLRQIKLWKERSTNWLPSHPPPDGSVEWSLERWAQDWEAIWKDQPEAVRWCNLLGRRATLAFQLTAHPRIAMHLAPSPEAFRLHALRCAQVVERFRSCLPFRMAMQHHLEQSAQRMAQCILDSTDPAADPILQKHSSHLRSLIDQIEKRLGPAMHPWPIADRVRVSHWLTALPDDGPPQKLLQKADWMLRYLPPLWQTALGDICGMILQVETCASLPSE
ncbi:MAG: M48 family metalloprotease [Pirellulaceae bacterium]